MSGKSISNNGERYEGRVAQHHTHIDYSIIPIQTEFHNKHCLYAIVILNKVCAVSETFTKIFYVPINMCVQLCANTKRQLFELYVTHTGSFLPVFFNCHIFIPAVSSSLRLQICMYLQRNNCTLQKEIISCIMWRVLR